MGNCIILDIHGLSSIINRDGKPGSLSRVTPCDRCLTDLLCNINGVCLHLKPPKLHLNESNHIYTHQEDDTVSEDLFIRGSAIWQNSRATWHLCSTRSPAACQWPVTIESYLSKSIKYMDLTYYPAMWCISIYSWLQGFYFVS